VLHVDQAQECLVDQSRRLHAEIGAVAAETPPGDATQLVVDERHQRIQRTIVAIAPGPE